MNSDPLKPMFDGWKMKPMIILPPDAMHSDSIKMLRDNGICVVTAKDPAAVKFVDPLPVVSSRTQIEMAAISLSRKLINRGYWQSEETRKQCASTFVDLLVNGSPLDPATPRAEIERGIFNEEKRLEIQRIAREEARAERATAKAAKDTAAK